MDGNEDPAMFSPDGLVGRVLDELIDRSYAEVAHAPQPTSALLDGSAAEARQRRMQRRALATRVRLMPVCAARPDTAPTGAVAA